jgi:hypothetical protein
MRKFIGLITLTLLIASCGDNNYYNVNKDENITGSYLLSGPSQANCIRLQQRENGLIDVVSECQSLVTVNPENDTLGQFPVITAKNLMLFENKIVFTKNIKFDKNTHDVEEDVLGDNIEGKKRVDVLIEFKENILHLNIKVYDNADNSNINKVIVNRTFKERT